MEAIRKYIDASSLMAVMALPKTFRNRKLEVLVFPMEEQEPEKTDILSSNRQNECSIIQDRRKY